MEGRAQANTTYHLLLPSLQGSGKKLSPVILGSTPLIQTLLSDLTSQCILISTLKTGHKTHLSLLTSAFIFTKAYTWLIFYFFINNEIYYTVFTLIHQQQVYNSSCQMTQTGVRLLFNHFALKILANQPNTTWCLYKKRCKPDSPAMPAVRKAVINRVK